MVVGFAFSHDMTKVLLIEKKREPEGADMIGTYNGIGGHALPRETYLEAMRREFNQEAGIIVPEWVHFAISEGPDWRLYFFATDLATREWRRVKKQKNSITDERVVTIHTKKIATEPKLYHDLRFMIPLAIARLNGEAPTAIIRLDWRDM